jgi:hypothetical protein
MAEPQIERTRRSPVPRHRGIELYLAHRPQDGQARRADAITAVAGSMPFVYVHGRPSAPDDAPLREGLPLDDASRLRPDPLTMQVRPGRRTA